ncbi:unnamed protein product [Adineta ricciae]|nr:unnamed protein product [Adineta ricciae]
MTKITTRESWKFSAAVGILMNTRGLVELIALNIGLQLHILSPRLFTMFIIMALVTTFMTCPLLWLVYLRTYKPEPLISNTQSNKINIPGRRYLRTHLPTTRMSSVFTKTVNLPRKHYLKPLPTVSSFTKY